MKTTLIQCGLGLILVVSQTVLTEAAPVSVFVAPVKRIHFVDEVEALGTLQANENVNLAASVTERISAILFSDNQRVMLGDVLIQMDVAEEEAELVEEQSRRDEAQKQVDRLRPLVNQKASSQSILDQQERELKSAQARVKAAQSRIDERRVIAPFDGVVGIRNISVGTLAQPGMLLTTIDDDSVMKLDFSIPEIFLATLKPGIQIDSNTRAYPNTTFSGMITSVDSRVDPITRAVAARAMLQNPQRLLKAGMLMRLVLKKNPRDTLVIPEEALIKRSNNNYVMKIVTTDNKTIAKRQQVDIGARRVGDIEILRGLSSGDRVVTHGMIKLGDGSEVFIAALDKGNQSLTDLLNQAKTED